MPQPRKNAPEIQSLGTFSKPWKIRKVRNHPEQTEQVKLVRWLRGKGLMFSSLNNSFYGLTAGQMAKAKAQGLNPGVPDLMVVIPYENSLLCSRIILFIEMKAAHGRATPEQTQWILALNNIYTKARICKEFEEAKAFVEEYLNNR
jgi:hypothetical protein